ncbi:hypothetical protein [Aporhodopirellula aestuarii]|uniref:Uncharacterized protein n=1 Tax=Aporhodopirellula aestuarii TaxID=2950107 RepID=A0ABT0UDH1_9BACT|nr:hypothetical protein [Aporhodopirellula aestuarii]MCM2374837.1 hypothetical protein [Aporhodopirellula aestuarii]
MSKRLIIQTTVGSERKIASDHGSLRRSIQWMTMNCLLCLVGAFGGCAVHHQQLCESIVNPRVCPNCLTRNLSECHCFAPTTVAGYHETLWHPMGDASFESPVVQNYAASVLPIEIGDAMPEVITPTAGANLNNAPNDPSSRSDSSGEASSVEELPVEVAPQTPLGRLSRDREVHVVTAWQQKDGELRMEFVSSTNSGEQSLPNTSSRRVIQQVHAESPQIFDTKIVDPKSQVDVADVNLDYYRP